MRVGVVLGDFVPQDGGGFTFVSEVVKALALRCENDPDLNFIFFANPRAAEYLKALCTLNYEVVSVRPDTSWARTMASLKLWIPLFGEVWKRKSALENSLVEHRISFVWFAGGSGEVLDIPYAATVWDVQHRTHPWFPEVSADSVWNGREVLFSTYLQRASIVICGTRIGAQQLTHFYQVEPERFAILPHPTPQFAIDNAGRLAGKLPDPINASSRYFIYPAQYWPHKNHVGLIRAFAEFNVGLEQEFKLVFVGSDKGNKEFLEELVAEYDLRDRVCFLGFVDREQLVSLYQNAVALVYPSFSGPENLPPLEAFALECPVVYSDFPGAREQLGDAALYFDPCSFQTILLSLRQIASDSALRTRLVQSGHERAMAWRCSDFVEGVVGAISKFKPIRDAWR